MLNLFKFQSYIQGQEKSTNSDKKQVFVPTLVIIEKKLEHRGETEQKKESQLLLMVIFKSLTSPQNLSLFVAKHC